MRTLVVTLVHRQYGPAMASWAVAFRRWLEEQPAARFDHFKLYGNPEADGIRDAVLLKYLDAQNLFLTGTWDVLIALEDDMVLPPDTFLRLHKMLHQGADIAYGVYVWRHALENQQWSAYTELHELGGRSLCRDPERAKADWGNVIEVAGVGLGVTAIQRRVLETVRFERRGAGANDWYLALDAKTRGFIQRCDLGLVCGHMSLTPSPRIYWPDPTQPDLVRTEFLSCAP